VRAKIFAQANPSFNRERVRRCKLKKWGMTLADLQVAFENQRGLCAICEVPTHLDGGKRIHLDHCHKTNRFRGILCTTCNTALGKFEDDPARLKRAMKYLGAEHE
jgi:hypothetical protein